MIIERIRKSGYKLEINDDQIIIQSSRRLKDFMFTVVLTVWIALMVASAKVSDIFLFKLIQYIVFVTLLVGPVLVLVLNWRRKIIIKNGGVEISGRIKGKIEYKEILDINFNIDQSIVDKRVSINLKDRMKGATTLLVFYLKRDEVPEVSEFVDKIFRLISDGDGGSKTTYNT